MSTTAPRKRRAAAHRRHQRAPHARPPAQSSDPFTAIAEVYAQREAKIYRSSGVRIGASNVVHEVAHVPWMLGLTLPAPACHVGFSVDLGRRAPAPGAVVTCRRCLSARHGANTQPYTGQIPLF